MARDRQPAHSPRERTIPRETWGSSAPRLTPPAARSTAAHAFASARSQDARPSVPALDSKFPPPLSPLRCLLHIGLCRLTEYNPAIFRPQIRLRHLLNLLSTYGKESFENCIHELRLAIQHPQSLQTL